MCVSVCMWASVIIVVPGSTSSHEMTGDHTGSVEAFSSTYKTNKDRDDLVWVDIATVASQYAAVLICLDSVGFIYAERPVVV